MSINRRSNDKAYIIWGILTIITIVLWMLGIINRSTATFLNCAYIDCIALSIFINYRKSKKIKNELNK